jgi:hypothetical protein
VAYPAYSFVTWALLLFGRGAKNRGMEEDGGSRADKHNQAPPVSVRLPPPCRGFHAPPPKKGAGTGLLCGTHPGMLGTHNMPCVPEDGAMIGASVMGAINVPGVPRVRLREITGKGRQAFRQSLRRGSLSPRRASDPARPGGGRACDTTEPSRPVDLYLFLLLSVPASIATTTVLLLCTHPPSLSPSAPTPNSALRY